MAVIDNPIINGPYDEPTRHWRFDERGITDVLLDGRRRSESQVPVPRPRKNRAQAELDLRATSERVQRHDQVDQVRQAVRRWRSLGYPYTTATTRRLLTYWSDPARDNPILFAQREAAETAIYLAEAAARDGHDWIAVSLAEQNAVHDDGLPRVALKMATGSGKTVVMAMLIAWQTLNHVARRWDKTYSRRFLLVAPGITIRDRLRVLVPSDPGNYYAERDLVPADLQTDLRRAELVVTNFHSFLLRTTHEARGLAADTRRLVTARVEHDPFVETPPMMVARVLRGLSSTRGRRGGRLVILNDEAHHCYAPASGEVVTMTPGALGETEVAPASASSLKGDEKREAQARNADAGVWFSGLLAVAEATDLAAVYDLSATPFFLKGSGYREGLIFPWVVSDFSLVDAIEAGIVKIPRVPVVDDAEGDAVTYLNLWQAVDEDLKPSRARTALASGLPLPTTLAGAMASLYSSYERAFARWERSRQDDSHRAGATPPVFIVVCPSTAVSRWVYDAIAGRSVPVEDPDAPDGVRTVHAAGSLPLLSNVVDGAPLGRPRSILVDSAQLESEDALTKDFRAVAADEIAAFRREYAAPPGRTPTT